MNDNHKQRILAARLALETTRRGIRLLEWNRRGNGSVLLPEGEADLVLLTLRGMNCMAKAELKGEMDE